MTRKTAILLLVSAFLVLAPGLARAGDEDVKVEKKQEAPKEPDEAPVPIEPEVPDLTVGTEPEPASPTFDPAVTAPAPPAAAKKKAPPWDPDRNVDYSDLLGRVETSDPSRGVLPPAPGFRGYMPNMVALTYNDRTPGVGGIVEYSFNRIGAGVYYSYRPNTDNTSLVASESFLGVYGSYRWLPFDISPLLLVGVETAWQTSESFGGIAGFGIDWRIFSGWTALLGYTYHSTVHRGFLGGGLGWSF